MLLRDDSVGVVGLILSGGRGTRLGGGDKGLVNFGGRPLVLYGIANLQDVVDRIMISANRNEEVYRSFGLEVIRDEEEGYFGPLAGICAGMKAVEDAYIATLPCDMPHVPPEVFHCLLERLSRSRVPLVVAHDGMRLQSLLMLAHASLYPSIDDYLKRGERRVEGWIRSVPHQVQDVSQWRSCLSNINTREELKTFEGFDAEGAALSR